MRVGIWPKLASLMVDSQSSGLFAKGTNKKPFAKCEGIAISGFGVPYAGRTAAPPFARSERGQHAQQAQAIWKTNFMTKR